MKSALESRPRLGADVKIVRRVEHGRVYYIVKAPKEDKYYRFGEKPVALMRLMDGQRSPEEISEVAARTLEMATPPGQIADFAQKLKRLGIVQRSPAEEHVMAMERLRRERKRRSSRGSRGSILRLRFSAGDPDRFLDRVVGRIRWIWSPAFVAVSVALFVAYLIVTGIRWDDFISNTVAFVALQVSPWELVLLFGIMIGMTVIHEFGHALTTKAFGGEVHEMGAMLLYFQPAFYCNTSDSYLFQKRAHRLWVTFAGLWIELCLAGVGGLVWWLTEPGTLVNTAAFLVFLVGGLKSVFTNLNPLIPLDGYYALSDWLEIMAMRERAFGYWTWLLKKYVLGVNVSQPAVTPRERRIFLVYGGLAFAYSALIAVVGFLWLVGVFGRVIGPWVWLIVALMLGKLMFRTIGRARALATAASTRWRAGFLSGPRAGLLAAVVVVLVSLPFLIPWTYRASGDFSVEASPPAPVRVQTAGVLDRILVQEGDTVSAGAPIAVLWNPDLELDLLDRTAESRRLSVRRARAQARGDLSGAAEASAMLAEVDRELEILRRRRDDLVVRAPIAGIILGYRIDARVGERLEEGDELTSIASLGGRLARIRIPLKRAGELQVGQTAKLRLRTHPNLEFQSTVASVAPAAEDGTVEAIVYFPVGSRQPSPGMTGIGKVVTRRATIAHAISRAWRQTVRIDLWL